MWEFRRHPVDLDENETQSLKTLFEALPKLRELHQARLRFQYIFDEAPDRETAARWLRELKKSTEDMGLDFSRFFSTYDNYKSKILNYFDERKTSAVVEGINNKTRVITKRSYGIKTANTLWSRLILDLNRAQDAIK